MTIKAWVKTCLSHVLAIQNFCHNCGHPPEIFYVSNGTWRRVMGKDAHVYCLHCFFCQAKKKGMHSFKLTLPENLPEETVLRYGNDSTATQIRYGNDSTATQEKE